SEHGHEVYVAQERFGSVAKVLEQKFGEPCKASLVWRPQNTVTIDDEQGEKLLKLIENLNEHDDVQNVYANFEVSDALVQKMSAYYQPLWTMTHRVVMPGLVPAIHV